MKAIENKAEFDALINSGKFVLVDFFATWCGPCKVVGPAIEKMEPEYPAVAFCKVDVDECDEVAADWGISAMPTFYLYKDGNKIDEVIGASADKVRNMIAKHVK